MFCSKCGKELNDGSVFCNYCGSKISNNVSEDVVTKDKIHKKKNEIILLEAANDYISTMWPYYSKITEYKEEQSKLQEDIDNGCFSLIKTGVISSILGVVVLFFAIQSLTAQKSPGLIEGILSSIGTFVGVFFAIVGAVAIIVAIISFVLIPKRKKEIESKKSEIIRIDQELQKTDSTIRELLNDKKINTSQTAYQLYFPNSDADPNDISYIINLIKTGRADSFKEALNLYDEHLHRNNLERMASQQLNYARETANSAAVAAQAATEAASAARSTANAANYSAYYKQ